MADALRLGRSGKPWGFKSLYHYQIIGNEGSNACVIYVGMSNYNQKHSKELLEPVVKNSTSVAKVLRKLGLKQSGGNHSHITRRIKFYELDTSHFISPKLT